MKTKQCLVIVMTLLCLCVKAQNLRVTGVVRDKSDVIIGASVMVKKLNSGYGDRYGWALFSGSARQWCIDFFLYRIILR